MEGISIVSDTDWDIALFRPDVTDVDVSAVARAIGSGWIAAGAEVAAFESRTSAVLGRRTFATCSGSIALWIALRQVLRGDRREVVTTPIVCEGVVDVIRFVGGTPVFADLTTDTLALAPGAVAECLTERTGAVVFVHYGGLVGDIEPIRSLCDHASIPLIEDCASVFGGATRGGPVGRDGDFGIFSLNATKSMTTGEGGLLAWTQHGTSENYPVEGYPKLGMSDITAAMANAQLDRLPAIVDVRRRLAAGYAERLVEVPDVELLASAPGCEGTWTSALLRFDSAHRRGLAERALNGNGISARGVDAIPGVGLPPVADAARNTVLRVPLHARMSRQDMDRVVQCLSDAVGR
ncbi:DegT/DnrJ/EryC1/StrS family aminotransferase [Nocardia niwae]|uniref:DegT/DnrJ/EryC1/StrS aminotransferase family protein n=1 Tax=Nocardia niwae TaxID=626084 RepID=A0ABV2X912_9NOCA|nr:DegT/DnrJ/EryC1/StrS aminotransferase family protein [Nocardia niwae]